VPVLPQSETELLKGVRGKQEAGQLQLKNERHDITVAVRHELHTAKLLFCQITTRGRESVTTTRRDPAEILNQNLAG